MYLRIFIAQQCILLFLSLFMRHPYSPRPLPTYESQTLFYINVKKKSNNNKKYFIPSETNQSNKTYYTWILI